MQTMLVQLTWKRYCNFQIVDVRLICACTWFVHLRRVQKIVLNIFCRKFFDWELKNGTHKRHSTWIALRNITKTKHNSLLCRDSDVHLDESEQVSFRLRNDWDKRWRWMHNIFKRNINSIELKIVKTNYYLYFLCINIIISKTYLTCVISCDYFAVSFFLKT